MSRPRSAERAPLHATARNQFCLDNVEVAAEVTEGAAVHRLVWTVIAVILISAAPACSHNSSRLGTLTGRALLYGGPLTTSGKQALDGEPGQGVVVSVVGVDGRTIASATTRTDGTFTFQLAPGRYTVTGCATTTVQIDAGKETVHDLTCLA